MKMILVSLAGAIAGAALLAAPVRADDFYKEAKPLFENCADGSAGTRIAMTGLVGGAFSQMDSVNIGAPARTFETVNYRLYQDASGVWWLGVRTWVSGAWNQTNAVAGPLLPNTGLKLTYLDSTGAVTATDTLVRAINIIIRGQSTKTISIPGHPTGVYNDSLSVTVALRNN